MYSIGHIVGTYVTIRTDQQLLTSVNSMMEITRDQLNFLILSGHLNDFLPSVNSGMYSIRLRTLFKLLVTIRTGEMVFSNIAYNIIYNFSTFIYIFQILFIFFKFLTYLLNNKI